MVLDALFLHLCQLYPSLPEAAALGMFVLQALSLHLKSVIWIMQLNPCMESVFWRIPTSVHWLDKMSYNSIQQHLLLYLANNSPTSSLCAQIAEQLELYLSSNLLFLIEVTGPPQKNFNDRHIDTGVLDALHRSDCDY